MGVCAAVMTGPGAGAIATIGLRGDSAAMLLEAVFRPCVVGGADFASGRVVLGHIVDGAETVDQVTVGCEGPETFAIHCHGNPLIVEAIMELLRRHGAELLAAPIWYAQGLMSEGWRSALAIEAKQALATVKTVAGARTLSHQAAEGLGHWCRQWRTGSMSLEAVTDQAAGILRDSAIARRIISGCTIVLLGPPNTGKSTLLNALAGREKAIVTDIEGTTRDWVSAEIHIPPLAVTLIDTAGLDAAIADGRIDQTAQARSAEILQRADLVLYVLDASRQVPAVSPEILSRLAGRHVVTVFNKTDLPVCLDPTQLPPSLRDPVRLSARDGVGIDKLIEAIHHTLGTDTIDPCTPIAFTDRQRTLLERLCRIPSDVEGASIISELLESSISV